MSTPFGVPNKATGTMFSPVPCLTKTAGCDTEMVGLQQCMAAASISTERPTSFESEVDMILAATTKCSENISILMKFIDDNVLASSTKSSSVTASSNEIGRQLMSMVETLSPFGEDDEELNTNLKDLLMVIYLANLSKTQLMLNEKLSLL